MKTYDINKLKDPEIVRKYVNVLTVKAECGEHTTEISNGKWGTCQQMITRQLVRGLRRKVEGKEMIGSAKNVKKLHRERREHIKK